MRQCASLVASTAKYVLEGGPGIVQRDYGKAQGPGLAPFVLSDGGGLILFESPLLGVFPLNPAIRGSAKQDSCGR
jgi:hypothetical protein